ncbi:stage II sporulation protein E [uncultured Clostridium sp.]|uniref:stage II sporulation protein E n=1 Tax=uncultured Clostridium sp. TaxID=59620 RepID=UPI0028F0D601|nr:stage II sporulation protein E [uncultured Clostridium sp.]
MQYGADILPYQRIRNLHKEIQKKKMFNVALPIKYILYFIGSILISRVIMINLMAPFGIAFLIVSILKMDKRIPIVTGVGTVMGYLSVFYAVKNVWIYIIQALTLSLFGYIFNEMDKNKKLIISLGIIFFQLAIFNKFVIHVTLGLSIFNALFELACIFPIYYIVNYSTICIEEYKNKHLYSSEETISMAITLSLFIAGTWGINLFGLSIRNIIALTFIVMIGYVKDSSAGGACGVALGAIIGISTNNMVAFIGTYGICGLMAGIFKETGKWVSGIAYIVMFSILKLYSDIGVQFQIGEALVALAIFYLIPLKLYKKMEIELDWQLKGENLKENYIHNVKEIFNEGLTDFSQVLLDMRKTLENLADNDKLRMKTKSSVLIQNLADRVCTNCDMRNICWKRESYYTYSAFSELIEGYEECKGYIPKELERKCVKRSYLIENTKDIMKNHIIDEMWRKSLSECREYLATQVGNIAYSVDEMARNIDVDVQFDKYTEKDLRRVLNKNNIKYKNIFCYNNKKDKLVIKLSLNVCGGKHRCIKEVLPLINSVTGKVMCVSNEGCNIDTCTKTCSLTLEETPKYHISSYVGRVCKDGEKLNGDSYAYDKMRDGTYVTLISDGMGSGPEACQESGAAVELIEKFLKAGFTEINAINTVNSLMTIKFSEDEKFSTVDLNSIDLYTGQANFMKVGAVPSFIKSKDKVEVIKSKTLPIGVLDKVDVDIIKKQVRNGDILVMLSDGILDYNNEEAGKVDWLLKYLQESKYNNPEELCQDIICRVKELSNGKVKDDMTVIVSKVYSLY